VFANSGNPSIQILNEVNGSSNSQVVPVSNIGNVSELGLYLKVDPTTGIVQPQYSLSGGQPVNVGDAVTLAGPSLTALQSSNQSLAIGIISTSYNSNSDFNATWDYMKINADNNNSGGAVTEDEISFVSKPTSLNQAQSYSFNLNYTANQNSKIGIAMFKGSSWITSGTANVAKGSGTEIITVNLTNSPALGNDYWFRAFIRPQGGNFNDDLDRDQAFNVSIGNDGGVATQDNITFFSKPTSLNQAQSLSFNLNYTATVNRTIGIGVFKGGAWIKSGSTSVTAGSGTQTVTVNFNSLPATGNNYSIQAWIRPQGSTPTDDLDREFANNVSITNGANRLVSDEGINVEVSPNPLGSNHQLYLEVDLPGDDEDVEIAVFDSQGKLIYAKQYNNLTGNSATYILDVNTVFGDQKGFYILNVSRGDYHKLKSPLCKFYVFKFIRLKYLNALLLHMHIKQLPLPQLLHVGHIKYLLPHLLLLMWQQVRHPLSLYCYLYHQHALFLCQQTRYVWF